MSGGKQQRLIVLQLVRENKEVLLGAFTPILTKKRKEECWETVRMQAIAAGATGLATRNWAYLRDSVWQAARRDAVAKKDREKTSGEGTVEFNEVDELVFDIIGRKSAVLEGMNVKDSEEIQISDDDEDPELQAILGKEPKSEVAGPSAGSKLTSSSKFRSSAFASPTPSRASKKSREPSAEEDLDLEIKKARLQLLKSQFEGQELLNQQTKLAIEKLNIEVEGSRLSASGSRSQSQSNLLGFNYGPQFKPPYEEEGM